VLILRSCTNAHGFILTSLGWFYTSLWDYASLGTKVLTSHTVGLEAIKVERRRKHWGFFWQGWIDLSSSCWATLFQLCSFYIVIVGQLCMMVIEIYIRHCQYNFIVIFFFSHSPPPPPPRLHSPAWALASSTKSGWISWRLLNNFLFYRVGLLSPRPTPILDDHASVLYPPEAGWPSYIPGHRVPILVASYDTHGLRWDYSYSPVTTRANILFNLTQSVF
jgi:hypothetical protein